MVGFLGRYGNQQRSEVLDIPVDELEEVAEGVEYWLEVEYEARKAK